MKRPLTAFLVSAAVITSLSGCGTQPADRALSGAFLGAAAGGAVFALFPSSPITLGLATGGALGAIAGGLSLPDYLYMGEPAWQTHEFDTQSFRFQRREALTRAPQPMMMPQAPMQQQPMMAPQPQLQQQPMAAPQAAQQPMMAPEPPVLQQQQYRTAPQPSLAPTAPAIAQPSPLQPQYVPQPAPAPPAVTPQTQSQEMRRAPLQQHQLRQPSY